MSEPDAEHFSDWYAAMGETPDKDRIWTHALGLPDHVLSSSVLTGPALDEVARSGWGWPAGPCCAWAT